MWIDLSVFLFVSPFVVVTFVIRVKRLPGSFLGGMDEIQRVMMLETSRRSPLGHISFQTAQSAGTFFKWKRPVSTLLIMLMSRSCWVFFMKSLRKSCFSLKTGPSPTGGTWVAIQLWWTLDSSFSFLGPETRNAMRRYAAILRPLEGHCSRREGCRISIHCPSIWRLYSHFEVHLIKLNLNFFLSCSLWSTEFRAWTSASISSGTTTRSPTFCSWSTPPRRLWTTRWSKLSWLVR